MSPTVIFVHTLLANVHCNEWLVWFGFYYTIRTGSSPGVLLDSLWLPPVREILGLSICRTSPFKRLSVHWWGRCWGVPTQGWIWAWVVPELDILLALPHLYHHQGEPSRTALASSPNAAAGKGQRQLSCWLSYLQGWLTSPNCTYCIAKAKCRALLTVAAG